VLTVLADGKSNSLARANSHPGLLKSTSKGRRAAPHYATFSRSRQVNFSRTYCTTFHPAEPGESVDQTSIDRRAVLTRRYWACELPWKAASSAAMAFADIEHWETTRGHDDL
jgi:hypothetical protein